MSHTTLISVEELAASLRDPSWVIVDCRFSLDDTERGRRDYRIAHIPGAIYAHLDEDMSGPVVPGLTGRHPLPEIETLSQTLGRMGISAGVQVIAYDDWGGVVASRLWWMLRWLGHQEVAVLDGGWPRWLAKGQPAIAGEEANPARRFSPHPRPELVVDAEQVEAMRQDTSQRLFDARSADRYRGENETLDPIAGHIAGALCAPYANNLAPDERFLSPEQLHAHYESLLSGATVEETVFYCGSGVSAAHNLLAMAYAGMGNARLYAGSWSEWITDPNRPVDTGD